MYYSPQKYVPILFQIPERQRAATERFKRGRSNRRPWANWSQPLVINLSFFVVFGVCLLRESETLQMGAHAGRPGGKAPSSLTRDSTSKLDIFAKQYARSFVWRFSGTRNTRAFGQGWIETLRKNFSRSVFYLKIIIQKYIILSIFRFIFLFL